MTTKLKTIKVNGKELAVRKSFTLFGRGAYIARYFSGALWDVFLEKDDGTFGGLGLYAETMKAAQSQSSVKIEKFVGRIADTPEGVLKTILTTKKTS